MRLTFVAALAFVTMIPSVFGAAYIYHYEVSGTCEQLTVDGTDITNACEDNILHVAYDDGRGGIHVFAGDKIIIFSSKDERTVGDRVEQDIDQMILGNRGEELLTVTARGTCIYGDAFAGAAHFECSARIKGYEPFHLIFYSDGSTPTDLAQ